MSGYTQQASKNTIGRPMKRKWYENMTPQQLASAYKEPYNPSKMMKSILNWHNWYEGAKYIADGNYLNSKNRPANEEERRNAILRTIELKDNLKDVERYFNENKINMFNFVQFKKKNVEEEKHYDDLADIIDILNRNGSNSSNEEQQYSMGNNNKINCDKLVEMNKQQMEEEKPSYEDSSDTDLNELSPIKKESKFERITELNNSLDPSMINKDKIKREKRPKLSTSKKTVPRIKTP